MAKLKLKTPKSLPTKEQDLTIARGIRLFQEGKSDQAIYTLESLITTHPDNFLALCRLGEIYFQKQRFDKATISYKKAVDLELTNPETWCKMAQAAFFVGQYQFALNVFNYVSDKFKYYKEVDLYKFSCFAFVKDYENAVTYGAQYLDKTKESNLQVAYIVDLTMPYLLDEQKALKRFQEIRVNSLRWKTINEYLSSYPKENPDLSFSLAYYNFNVREVFADQCQVARNLFPALNYTASNIDSIIRTIGNEKIRIGFVSSYIGKLHSIGHCYNSLVDNLDRKEFESIIFEIPGHSHDAGTKPDKLVKLTDNNLDINRQIISEQKPHILFYPDIGMSHMSYMLSMSRLAPVQSTTHGHPVTSGINTVDYFMSSAIFDHEKAQDHYSESLIRIPSFPVCYARPKLIEENNRFNIREKLNLDKSDHIYICAQTPFKISDTIQQCIAGILENDPKAYVVIIKHEGFISEKLFTLLQKKCGSNFDRIKAISPLNLYEFNYLLTQADVLLDTFPFGGGNTTMQGLCYGVPIICFESTFLRGRMTASYYRHMGITEPIATSIDEYIKKSMELATNKDYRYFISKKILERNDLLFDRIECVNDHMNAFRASLSKLI